MNEAAWVEGDELSARVGELRRLTIMFCDVVGSTELSSRWEPEAYRDLMAKYRAACREVIESEFEGHIVHVEGDGLLAVFGFPVAHENDAERAVRAALGLLKAVRNLSAREHNPDEALEIRVAVHNGPLYVDLGEEDVYGLAANVGARLQTIAAPGTVVLSDEVRKLVEDRFETEAGDPQLVKGLADPLQPFRVLGERRTPVQRSWATPLVERDSELERLRQAWTLASSGGGQRVTGVLVSGDAGVGKSRLVATFADEVSSEGASLLELRGSPFHGDAGFHPIRTLIEDRCGITEETDPAARLQRLSEEVTDIGLDAGTTVPLLAPVLGIAPDAGYEPVAAEGQRLEEQIASAARDYVIACTGDRTLIVAENLHWFDGATRALLASLAENGPRDVLVVGTSRVSEQSSWEEIALGPLTQAGRLKLIGALADGLAENDRLALASRSGGIPLYLEELVRAGPDPGSAPVAGAALAPGVVPAALYEPLVARLYVTSAAIPVAAAVAAAGEQVDRSVLAATVTLPAEQLDATLHALCDAHILDTVSGRPDRYQFRHELLREVAYELQPPSWRRKVHSRLCDVLTREEPSDWRVVALHFERAERYEEAANAYRQTAEAARRRGALEEARSQLARAIDLIHPLEGEHTDLEVDLRLRRGFLAMSLEGAGSTDAAADYEQCLVLAGAEPAGDAMFSTLISLWAYQLSRADLERARETGTTLRSALTGSRSYFRPPNLAGFGMLDWFEGNFTGALKTLTDATAKLADIGDFGDISHVWFVPHDAAAAMYVYLAVARFMAGDTPGADASLERSRTIAAGLDFPQGPWSSDYAHWLGSWIWLESGRLHEAGIALGELQASSASHGFATWGLLAGTQAVALDAVASLRAEEADASALIERANALSGLVELWKALELRIFLPFYLTTCGALCAAAGESAGARKHYEESLQLAADTGMRFYDAETARRLAHLAPDTESKAADLGAALELARSQGARPFELRIALDLHELLGEEGREPLELAMSAFPDDAVSIDLEHARARSSGPR